jgi:hypothetical protein
MLGTLIFVHGTGVRDVSGHLDQIRGGAQKNQNLNLDPARVLAAKWGELVGPMDRDVKAALPPEPTTRALVGGMDPVDAEAAVWSGLIADPLLELRLIGATRPHQTRLEPQVGVLIPADDLRNRVREINLSSEDLSGTGVSPAELTGAAAAIAASPEFAAAAAARDNAADPELVEALARAVVATMTATRQRQALAAASATIANPQSTPASGDAATLPPVCTDGAIRNELVHQIVQKTGTSSRGLIGALGLDRVGVSLLSNLLVANRTRLTEPLVDFIRDVAFYLQHGETIRKCLATTIQEQSGHGPVVVLGHSLGGIAAVDLLAHTAAPADPPVAVDLLVTVGCQAPVFYLMDALPQLRPRHPEVTPSTPWLNIYNRQDLLAFCASAVFPNTRGIVDAEIDAGVPFPASHSAYWGPDRTYDLLAEHWPKQ